MKKRILYPSLVVIVGALLWFGQDQQIRSGRKIPKSPPAPSTQTPIIKEGNLSTGKTTIEKLDSLFTRANKRLGFHGSVLIAQNGKLVFTDQYGIANFQTQTQLSDMHSFQLASVSKQFTAAAILLLVQDKLIRLDDSLNYYFPNFPYPGITIRHLLHHTSGLPKYFWIVEHKWPLESVPNNQQVIDLMYKEVVNFYFPPNSNFDYSNTGYFILSAIVEKVSGMSFKKFMHERIFYPCGMDDTYIFRHGIDTIKPAQIPGYRLYRRYRYREIPLTINDGVTGDKNVYTTALDMFKWYTALENGFLLSDSLYKLMKTPGKNKYGRTLKYGMGYRIENNHGVDIVYHNGKWNGFRTTYTIYPDSRTLIIILEHTNSASVVPLRNKAYQIVTAES